ERRAATGRQGLRLPPSRLPLLVFRNAFRAPSKGNEDRRAVQQAEERPESEAILARGAVEDREERESAAELKRGAGVERHAAHGELAPGRGQDDPGIGSARHDGVEQGKEGSTALLLPPDLHPFLVSA